MKPKTSEVSILALFGSELLSSVDSRATDIILEGQELVILGATKMTLIILKGGLEEESPQGSEPIYPIWPQNGATVASTFLLGPASPNGPTNSYSLP